MKSVPFLGVFVFQIILLSLSLSYVKRVREPCALTCVAAFFKVTVSFSTKTKQAIFDQARVLCVFSLVHTYPVSNENA